MTSPIMKQKRPQKRPTWLNLFGLFVLALLGVGMFMALVTSPADVNQGNLIRIMYAHVSVAWISFVAIIATAIFGSLFLWRSKKMDDILAVASAEMAVLYAGLTLIGGMTYSKPTLNTWWTWDAKLTLTALMFALLVGYFIVRGLIDDPERRGRVSAVVSIITAVSLPFNYLASEWFRTLHPAKSVNLDGSGVTMEPAMLQTLLFNVAVAGLIYVYFMFERVRIGRLEAKLSEEEERESAPRGEVVHV